ncbi:class I SAM-dependent methyltransferase [Tenacibaculum sediminilitoris]|uniref:class I SAM-dependent methyltransferase n=1 Tax=Tenacibaculum sediminilitoris TaxID=1820334 RepID=UPI0038B50DA7
MLSIIIVMHKKSIEIHETAFVTSTFRSLNEDLSRDVYAKLWGNSRTNVLVEKYLNQVCKEEVSAHCLRNRFFLEEIERLKPEVLINFGSGFSMYPFLLNEHMINVEIDKKEVILCKEEKIKEFQKEGKLPKRTIYFIGVDFSKEYVDVLLETLKTIKGSKSSFILIEGVLFFLSRKDTDKLFELFSKLQEEGDYVGSASFQNDLKNTQGFKKLLDFCNNEMIKTEASDWQTIEDDFYTKNKNYSLENHQDYFSLSKKYNNQVKLEKKLILNEYFYILKKIV